MLTGRPNDGAPLALVIVGDTARGSGPEGATVRWDMLQFSLKFGRMQTAPSRPHSTEEMKAWTAAVAGHRHGFSSVANPTDTDTAPKEQRQEAEDDAARAI